MTDYEPHIGDVDTAKGQARRAEEAANLDERRTGGSGSKTSPLSDEDYQREMSKLAALSSSDAKDDQ